MCCKNRNGPLGSCGPGLLFVTVGLFKAVKTGSFYYINKRFHLNGAKVNTLHESKLFGTISLDILFGPMDASFGNLQKPLNTFVAKICFFKNLQKLRVIFDRIKNLRY